MGEAEGPVRANLRHPPALSRVNYAISGLSSLTFQRAPARAGGGRAESHLKEVLLVEEAADVVDDLRADLEDAALVRVEHQV